MTTRAITSLCCLVALAGHAGLAGCSKAEHDPAHPVRTDNELTAQDMPLTDDFRKAAAKLITADNYREQLARVERELAQLAKREEKERQLDAEESLH
jgi:hypothetical protein